MKKILISAIAATSLLSVAVAQTRPITVRGARVLGRAGGRPASSKIEAGPTPRPTASSRSSGRNLLVYVITVGFPVGAFGAVDLGSGTFLPIGPGLPADVGAGLVPGPATSLLTLTFSGNLAAIDPFNGTTSVIGATGLRDCSVIGTYDPLCANVIGRLDATVYATDFAQNLYSVDQATGAAELIGPTGIPPLTFAPLSENPDGSVNVYGESLFSARGKLYAFFVTAAINFETGVQTPLTSGAIYHIDPATRETMPVTPTNSGLSSIVIVNDTIYGFNAITGQVVTVDLTTGQTTPVSDLDPAAGVIAAATPAHPAPEVGH